MSCNDGRGKAVNKAIHMNVFLSVNAKSSSYVFMAHLFTARLLIGRLVKVFLWMEQARVFNTTLPPY